MSRMLTCIVCPNGCELSVEQEKSGEISVYGASCPRGESYARQELLHPMRTVSSSVLVLGGNVPLVSVRLNRPVPKEKIPDIMHVIHGLKIRAPIRMGEVLVPDILGLNSDVIATASVLER